LSYGVFDSISAEMRMASLYSFRTVHGG